MRHNSASHSCVAPFAARKARPTLNANPRGWRRVALALALGGLLAGCSGAALTSNVLSGNATSSYLDIVQHANPESVGPTANALKRIISSRGDNTTERLIARVNEAKGSCDQTGPTVRCVLDKSIIERNCFQGRCGESRKQWTLSISWRDAPSLIDPQVTLKMSWPEKL
jgi:hypothetical protein